jgi:hypothetical protein
MSNQNLSNYFISREGYGLYSVRKPSKINAGFSPCGTLLGYFGPIRDFFRSLSSRVGLPIEVGHAAEDLQDHPEIAVRAEVCNPDAFELAA